MQPIFFEEENSLWEVVTNKVQRKITGFNNSIMMVHVRFEKGGIGPVHNHYHTQVTHIVSGEFKVTINQETRILKQGDSFFVPSMVMHGVLCLQEGMLIDVFNPAREDFIK